MGLRRESIALIDPAGRLQASFLRFNPLNSVRAAVQKAVADLAQDQPVVEVEPEPEPVVETPAVEEMPETEDPIRRSTWAQVKIAAPEPLR
ncbi:MAG: hypothetical protein GKR89_04875 [Candidatus Latescibacteria bacterium]|nr:hypothetical protein [Candidatus Latescibacterota bacterium]